MEKDPKLFLKHILESIENIHVFIGLNNKTKFKNDKLIQSAVIRQIEIIGEAVKNLPREFILKHPSVAWSEIAGTRDKMIHYYFGVDLDLVWDDILKKEIPYLKTQIEEILIDLKEAKK
jgi:uncharacterized protein with HEPN domain